MGTGLGGSARGRGISLLSPTHCFAQMGIIKINVQPTQPPPPRIRILVVENSFSFSFLSCQDFWKSLSLFPHPISICFRRLCQTGVIINISMNFLAV